MAATRRGRIVAKPPSDRLLTNGFPWLTRYENLCASCFAVTPVPVPSPMPVPIPAPTPAPTTRPPTPLESWLLGGCYDVGGVRAGAARLHGRDERADGDLRARVATGVLVPGDRLRIEGGLGARGMARAQSAKKTGCYLAAFSGRFADFRWFCALCCFNAVISSGNPL